MSSISRAPLNALVAVFLWAGACFAGDPQALLGELQRSYDAAKDLSARFVQTSYLAAAGLDKQVSGKVVFRKGGKMRWTYEGDDPQEIVSDGKVLWIYQVRDKNATRQELRKLPPESRLGLDLLSGLTGVSDAFAVTGCGDLCLELKPRKPRPEISRIVLEVDAKTRGVKTVTTEDPLGNRTRVEFRDLRWNAGVKDEVFAFKVPRGVEVLEMPGDGG